VAATVRGSRSVQRFWQVCSLPDFRHQGSEVHARFVARLWQDLRGGYLGADYVAQAIAQLDNPAGDIDTLQGRIAAIRAWSYIAQRPDWVLAHDEMAARARAVETRLSDALHGRLTERFVNRRTTVLMRKAGADASLLPVRLGEDGAVLVDEEPIGHLRGFRFSVDPLARASDRKLLLAAAERHLPGLLSARLGELAADAQAMRNLDMQGADLLWQGLPVARLVKGKGLLSPRLRLDPALERLSAPEREGALAALEAFVAAQSERPLRPCGESRRPRSTLKPGPACARWRCGWSKGAALSPARKPDSTISRPPSVRRRASWGLRWGRSMSSCPRRCVPLRWRPGPSGRASMAFRPRPRPPMPGPSCPRARRRPAIAAPGLRRCGSIWPSG
jgi:ATP-dependent RNA helicase SUPV3L1/SUV3